jgi:hypothetical protein
MFNLIVLQSSTTKAYYFVELNNPSKFYNALGYHFIKSFRGQYFEKDYIGRNIELRQKI